MLSVFLDTLLYQKENLAMSYLLRLLLVTGPRQISSCCKLSIQLMTRGQLQEHLIECHWKTCSIHSRRTYQWKTTAVRRRINRKTKLVRKARKKEAKRQRAISKTQSTSSKNFQTADNNYVHDSISPEQTEIPKRFWSFIEWIIHYWR